MTVHPKLERVATRLLPSCPWLKRLGIYGFLFFLIKGLAWLILPALMLYLGSG